MRILVACEFSGRVRDAFLAKGHDALSCDLEPTEVPGPHYQGDVRDILKEYEGKKWDMMIAFPPCTYLAQSGMHWTTSGKRPYSKTLEALDFVRILMYSGIPKICIENPVGMISTEIKRPTQAIQPYQFGHNESKKTCLWLKGLPKLVPTKIMPKPPDGRWVNQGPTGTTIDQPGSLRGKMRSRTYEGIAKAMADQWG